MLSAIVHLELCNAIAKSNTDQSVQLSDTTDARVSSDMARILRLLFCLVRDRSIDAHHQGRSASHR
jgi:hypothetical protein